MILLSLQRSFGATAVGFGEARERTFFDSWLGSVNSWNASYLKRHARSEVFSNRLSLLSVKGNFQQLTVALLCIASRKNRSPWTGSTDSQNLFSKRLSIGALRIERRPETSVSQPSWPQFFFRSGGAQPLRQEQLPEKKTHPW